MSDISTGGLIFGAILGILVYGLFSCVQSGRKAVRLLGEISVTLSQLYLKQSEIRECFRDAEIKALLDKGRADG